MKPWLCLLALLLVSTSARAQELPGWLKVQPSYLAYEQPATPAEIKSHRRYSFLLAAGVGTMLAGTVYAGTFGVKGGACYEPEQRVPYALAVGIPLAAAGAAMVTAAAVKLARLPSSARDPRRGTHGKLALTGLGTFGFGFATAFAVNIGSWLGCISS